MKTTYTLLRYVHDVTSGEFADVGVVGSHVTLDTPAPSAIGMDASAGCFPTWIVLLLWCCLAPAVLSAADTEDRKPAPISQTPPIYPFDLLHQGTSGSATVSFIVEKDGSVSTIEVLETTHPDFGRSAWASVSKWRFSPGLKQGEPVRVRMTQSLFFDAPASPEEIARASVELRGPTAIGRGDNVPALLVSDRPMYPIAMIAEHKSGSVTAEFWVNASGQVENIKLTKSTDKRLEGPVLARLKTWKFDAPEQNGKPSRVRLSVTFAFNFRE